MAKQKPEDKSKENREAFERAAKAMKKEKYVLRLFVTGTTTKSM